MKRDSVCHHCERHSAECHASCEEYAQEVKRYEATRQARHEHLIAQAFTWGYESRERTRMMQRKKGHLK